MDDNERDIEELEERVRDILKDTDGLEKHSIAAIICIEDQIAELTAMLKLIKQGRVKAVYTGNKDAETFELDDFLFTLVR